jgi:hypothetical protein
MRSLRLLRYGAEAEQIRLKLLLRRQIGRVAMFGAAALLLLFALAVGHAAAFIALCERLTPLWSCAVLGGADLLVAALLAMLASASRPGAMERQALAQRRAAMDGVRAGLSLAALTRSVIMAVLAARRRRK